MQFRLSRPLGFSEIGRKPNNEDRTNPETDKLSAVNRCFVLCDGMGGHEQGEVAAEIVTSILRPMLVDNRTDPDVITPKRFNAALNAAYNGLDGMNYDPEKQPGTTMTCLYLGANGALVAHIGDSRVYQVRPGQGIIFRTNDHSLVNELIKVGELTEDEARNFPRRNVITRAMQPGLEHPYKADISILTDIQGGDYFFMCSDGILENVTDEALVEILSSNSSDYGKLNSIYTLCYGKTRDNYTCLLIPVDAVIGEPLATPDANDIQATPLHKTVSMPSEATALPPAFNGIATSDDEDDERTRIPVKRHVVKTEKKKNTLGSIIKFFLLVALILAVLAVVIVYAMDWKNENAESKEYAEPIEAVNRPQTEPATGRSGLPGEISRPQTAPAAEQAPAKVTEEPAPATEEYIETEEDKEYERDHYIYNAY